MLRSCVGTFSRKRAPSDLCFDNVSEVGSFFLLSKGILVVKYIYGKELALIELRLAKSYTPLSSTQKTTLSSWLIRHPV